MRSYYFFQSSYPQLMRAWRCDAGLVPTTGGHLVEGSSVDPATVARVRGMIRPGEKVLVVLDSNHSRDHVLALI